jgi:hypothetical protein
VNVAVLLELIEQRLVAGAPPTRLLESALAILTRTTQTIIDL